MQKILLFAAFILFSYGESLAFCGFYVAKADADLFNESSQVIMVRDGNHTVITMSNDFQGDVKDFAMVVPVPEVLKRSDIRVVGAHLFSKLDAYTAPRMVEYHDPEPYCPQEADELLELVEIVESVKSLTVDQSIAQVTSSSVNRKLKVEVKAHYKVDEYDIVILSAKQSEGLEKWLKWNGYKMPEGAREALEPYVKSGMNFFVVKVDLAQQSQQAYTDLRPLQIQFNSPKFMLPIRLGMANAKTAQDMIVYAFTKTGRVETTNYRTLKVPTDREIPHIFKNNGQFGEFYKAVFEKSWKSKGQNDVFLEYSWDLSASNPVKCDPCNSPLVSHSELEEAGVWWLHAGQANGYIGNLHVTRLHVRYARQKFPQDLTFMVTPNKERFQGRYVIRHPARGPFNCEKGETYLKNLKQRYQREVAELASLTGWATSSYASYIASVPEIAPRSSWYTPEQNRSGGSSGNGPMPITPPAPVREPAPKKLPLQIKAPAPASPGANGAAHTLEQCEEQDTEKLEAQVKLAVIPSEVPGSRPLSGTLLTFSGLILGLAFFIRSRQSNPATKQDQQS